MSFYGSTALNNENIICSLPDINMDVFNSYYEVYSEALGLDQTYISEGKVTDALNNLINDKENYNKTDVNLDNITVEDLKNPKKFKELKKRLREEQDEKKKKKLTKQLIAIFGSYIAAMVALAVTPIGFGIIASVCSIAIDISIIADSLEDGSKTDKDMIIKRLENLKKKIIDNTPEGKERDKKIEKIDKTIEKIDDEMKD